MEHHREKNNEATANETAKLTKTNSSPTVLDAAGAGTTATSIPPNNSSSSSNTATATTSAISHRTRADHTPTLGQIGRQTSVNFRLSHLSDSGAESCDADEQTQLIRTPSSRSHKFIIIPSKPPDIAASPGSTPFRQAISTASLASLAAAIQKQQQQKTNAQQQQTQSPTPPPPPTPYRPELLRQLSNATNNALRAAYKSSSQPSVNLNAADAITATQSSAHPPAYYPASDVAHQRHTNDAATMTLDEEQLPAMSPTTTTTATTAAGVTFTIDGCESDYDMETAISPPSMQQQQHQHRLISSINSASSLRPTPTASSGLVAGLRPRNDRNSSSMRSVVSAYISSSHDLAQQQQQHSPPTFHQSHHYLQPTASTSFGGQELSASSYLYRNHSANQIYSDVTSVRSLASIAVGSTDGRKLVIRRVPHTPDELFSLVHPPSPPPAGVDYDDDDSFLDVSDEVANLKPRQQHWGNKMQFVLACIGYSVGLGNVWRFPYMCYKSGGGVFLVPYCIILFICSIPLLFMELSVGQYTGRGPIGALGQLCPLFKGAGVASVVVSFLMSTYYSVIIGYSIYYFFTSFKSEMPWTGCDNRWNTIECWVPQRINHTISVLAPNTSRTPSEEFFENKVLQISPGIEYPGMMRWELFACLICAWLMVYFATWKSIKSSAKVRYFTATFPFVLIIILMGRAVTLDGAHEGLRYFFRPNWSELRNANVWINAASQNFNSLGITFGSMISFASYNKYNNNILHDTIAVSVVNILTSLLVGVFAFATLGNLALEQNTNVRDVIGDGPGLIFVVYPQAMAKMPYAQLWAVMFFFMLLCLGLNSQFAIVEVVVTSIQDGFPRWIKRHLGYHEIVVLIVCVISFGFGIPNLIQGGIYYFQLMDHYAASVSIMFLAFCQMIAIAWFYGTGRLSKNVKQMTGKAPSIYLKSCWILLGPCLLFAIWILSLINYQEPSYHNGKYKYPDWAYGIGWMFASFSLVCIPGYAVINLLRSTGDTFWERVRNTIRPNIYECRICGEHHCEHDFSEQEQYMLAQEMSASVYKPTTFVQTASGSMKPSSGQKPLYSAMQPQADQQQTEFTYAHDDHPSAPPMTTP